MLLPWAIALYLIVLIVANPRFLCYTVIMDEAITFTQSAFKHGVTEVAIRHAFAYVIGPNKIRVFHAMPCRKPWRGLANS